MRSVIQRNCFDVGRFCKESALNVLFKKWMFLPNIYWLPAMPKHPLKPGSKNAPKAERQIRTASQMDRHYLEPAILTTGVPWTLKSIVMQDLAKGG